MPDPLLGRREVTASITLMTDPMDDSAFDPIAERTLRALETALNDVDGIEADLESGILTIEFPDGVRFVVNSHRAARQIWMAAGASAWHFDVDTGTGIWTAKKSGDELWFCIGQQVGQKLGRPLELARR